MVRSQIEIDMRTEIQDDEHTCLQRIQDGQFPGVAKRVFDSVVEHGKKRTYIRIDRGKEKNCRADDPGKNPSDRSPADNQIINEQHRIYADADQGHRDGLLEIFSESLKKAPDNCAFLILHHLKSDRIHGNRRRPHCEDGYAAHDPEDRKNAAVEYLGKKAIQFIIRVKQPVHLIHLPKILMKKAEMLKCTSAFFLTEKEGFEPSRRY